MKKFVSHASTVGIGILLPVLSLAATAWCTSSPPVAEAEGGHPPLVGQLQGPEAITDVSKMIRYTDPKPHDGRDRSRTGLHHFGLLVDDIYREHERLKALGVEFDGTIKVNTSSDLAVHFWDPEGNRIHLTQVSRK